VAGAVSAKAAKAGSADATASTSACRRKGLEVEIIEIPSWDGGGMAGLPCVA